MNAASKVGIYNFDAKIVEVPLFQLIQWKHAIGLEIKGYPVGRKSVTNHVRQFLNAPPNYPRGQLFQHLVDSIDSINAQLEKL